MMVTKVIATRKITNVRESTTGQALHNVALFKFETGPLSASYRRELKYHMKDHTGIKWQSRV